ncbi:lariat debranching enzyme [Coprinopsis cinerea okayama7|uniref:Lariat debranching enzyme n=1 Tax=Coprinopsis cinerea (strain Okayama-7 / 130 / ATCC MYA-4618 / FGSC 9003) TaxID=240176 RepID=A8NP45_COPC7|nr:lariat debranching enzyme [Coprinopsis cinerea okayama7\|eukprot:XP_001835263.2 lariat debranching enzyme [Coprinopsis cinerea okayama7\
MSAPRKYRKLGDFYRYYTGQKRAPVLTLVVGGNHEASNHFWELYHGGWLAPNIYHMGNVGCVQVNGLRVLGLSGIFNAGDYKLGHFERLPYDGATLRSIYHVKMFDAFRASLLSPDLPIVVSHDWPQNIAHYGDLQTLLKSKPGLKADIDSGKLGSPPFMYLIKSHRPRWWFAAHHHVLFEATVPHDEVGTQTRFLALDKCIPKCHYLEVMEVDTPQPTTPSGTPTLAFDPEWLAITRALHPWFSSTMTQQELPSVADARALVAKELEWVENHIQKSSDGCIRVEDWQEFAPVAPGHDPDNETSSSNEQPPHYLNPQTTAFCKMLGIEDKVNT